MFWGSGTVLIFCLHMLYHAYFSTVDIKCFFSPKVFSSNTTGTKVHIPYNLVKELWLKVKFLSECLQTHVYVCMRLMFLISHL